MSESMTLARPYAKAVFSLAVETSTQQTWTECLALLCLMMENPQMRAFVQNQTISNNKKAEVVIELAKAYLQEHMVSFVKVLAKSQRLLIIPDIALCYQAYRNEAEGRQDVSVYSAVVLSQEEQQRLRDSLSKKLQREIHMSFELNEALLGGVVIRIGDKVIDSSVKGRLAALHQRLLTD